MPHRDTSLALQQAIYSSVPLMPHRDTSLAIQQAIYSSVLLMPHRDTSLAIQQAIYSSVLLMPHKDTSLAIQQAIYWSQMMGRFNVLNDTQGHKPSYLTSCILIPNDGTIQCSKCHTRTQA